MANPLNISDELYRKAVHDCQEQMASIASFDGLVLERRGVWVWVTGNTRKHHVAIKGAGFRYAAKKQAWYWKPSYIASPAHKTSNNLESIRKTWEQDVDIYQTEGVAV